MQKRALAAVVLISLSLAGPLDATYGQPAGSNIDVAVLECASAVARTLADNLAKSPGAQPVSRLGCNQPDRNIAEWSATKGLPVVIVDQDRSDMVGRQFLKAWYIWKPALSAQTIVVVARAPDKTDETELSGPEWLKRRGDSSALRVGYLSPVIDRGAVNLVSSELKNHPVEPVIASRPSDLFDGLRSRDAGRRIDIALVPGDHNERLYTEFARLLEGNPRTVRWSPKWQEPVRFTSGGAAYTVVPGANGANNYGLLRAERSRGAGRSRRFTHGDREIVKALRQLAGPGGLSADLKFPLVITRDPDALESHASFKQGLAAGFAMSAFWLAATGGHLCESPDMTPAFTSYFLSAYLAEPSPITSCGLWSQYELADEKVPFPYGIFKNSIGSGPADCREVMQPTSEQVKQEDTCKPPIELSFANLSTSFLNYGDVFCGHAAGRAISTEVASFASNRCKSARVNVHRKGFAMP